jgi:hypothetical protein
MAPSKNLQWLDFPIVSSRTLLHTPPIKPESSKSETALNSAYHRSLRGVRIEKTVVKTCTPIAQLCFSTTSKVRVAAISFDLTRALRERNKVPWS